MGRRHLGEGNQQLSASRGICVRVGRNERRQQQQQQSKKKRKTNNLEQILEIKSGPSSLLYAMARRGRCSTQNTTFTIGFIICEIIGRGGPAARFQQITITANRLERGGTRARRPRGVRHFYIRDSSQARSPGRTWMPRSFNGLFAVIVLYMCVCRSVPRLEGTVYG